MAAYAWAIVKAAQRAASIIVVSVFFIRAANLTLFRRIRTIIYYRYDVFLHCIYVAIIGKIV